MKIDIKKFIEISGISRSELSKMLGISYPTMLSIYNGDATNIRLETLEKLCLIFNCTPNDILIFDNDKNNSQNKDNTHKFIPFINQSHIITKNFDKLLDNAIVDIKIEKDTDGNVIGIPFYKFEIGGKKNDDPHE